MCHHARVFLRAMALFLVTLPVCTAGVCTSDPLPSEHRHELEFFAGYSPVSTTLIGVTSGSRFVEAGFSYSYRCWAWKRASISFAPGIMPAAVVLEPAPAAYRSTRRVYGFGITPLGFRAEFLRTGRVYPFIQTDGGIIASTQPVPATSETGLNFLVDLGAGVRYRPKDRKYAFELGYKLLHISNAATSYIDPGVDNNVFYVGFVIFR
jgi:Lipid A 3-O-deacylase (PagL)